MKVALYANEIGTPAIKKLFAGEWAAHIVVGQGPNMGEGDYFCLYMDVQCTVEGGAEYAEALFLDVSMVPMP